MQKKFRKNYIKVYFWQGIALVLNFISMFIVIPYLASKPNIYGIYTICISVSIFLAYADLGFIGVGQKYAAEYFAKKERTGEMKVIGFAVFILIIFLVIFSVVFFILSLNPNLLVNNLESSSDKLVASYLLLIIAFSTPTTMFQRLAQSIYGIRIEEYIVHRFNIFANILKILSVLWFFRTGHYNIVSYFLFIQIVNFFISLMILVIAHKRYDYNFRELIKYVRFNKNIFLKTKSLAFSSLFLIFTWILYYELDPTIIGKLLGANQVALYAIGLTILSFFRSIFNILYSPFNARFNHFIGLNDFIGLKNLYQQILIFLTPLVVFPIIAITIMAKPVIITWVGTEYVDSIKIAQLLILCNLLAFITYPTSILLMAQEKIKEMYFVNTLLVLVFWGGILISFKYWDLHSFAIFKLIAFAISAIAYYSVMLKFLQVDIIYSLKMIIQPIILPIVFLVVTSFLFIDYLPQEKSRINFLIVIFIIGLLLLGSIFILYISSPIHRKKMRSIYISVISKSIY